MINFNEEIVNLLKNKIDFLEEEEINRLIEIPPNPELGDYAFPAFTLAKNFRKAPNMIAEELASSLESEYFSEIKATGPYINFFVDDKKFAKTILDRIKVEKEDFGRSDIGKNKNVVIDYSSPNIAKPFHIGHIRSTVIGQSLSNIYDFLGYNTISVNHLGDYGTQFGMLITAFKLWGDEEAVRNNPIPELLKLYVRINSEAEEDESLLIESRDWFRRLEDGDEEAVELWEFFREESLKEFDRVYSMLGTEFDSFNGESFYSDKMDPVIEELKEKNLLTKSQDSMIVDLEEYDMPPMLVLKSDGSTLYATRDLAAAEYRYDNYEFYRNIYVVGSQQILHFKQLFKVLELLGKPWANNCVHVPFGMVSLPDGTLSTRRGKVVFLEDVLNTAIDKTMDIIKDRDVENKEELASDIGIGAVIFQELFNDRNRDYVFDWDSILSFEGETGPYVQYTHARICSLLRRGDFSIEDDINTDLLESAEEKAILKLIYSFDQTVIDASEKNQPFFITRHVVELAKTFNSYYNSTSINVDDLELKKARLFLCYACKIVIKNGLMLLGIKSPERM